MAKKKKSDLQAVADLAQNVTRLALERTAAEISAGTHRDPAGAARNAAVVYGIAVDKQHAIEDRPEPVDLTGDPKEEGMRLLKKFGIEIPAARPHLPELPQTSRGLA